MITTIRARIVTSISTSGILAMLDTWGGTRAAIFAGRMIPEEFQHLNNSILIYPTSPQGPGDIKPMNFTLACRQQTEMDSIALSELVYAALNRNFFSVTGGRLYMQASIAFPAMMEDDHCWLCPVEVNIRNNL